MSENAGNRNDLIRTLKADWIFFLGKDDEITEATPNPKLSLDNVWLANLVYWYMFRFSPQVAQ